MKMNLFSRSLLIPAVLLLLATSCKKEVIDENAERNVSPTSSVSSKLAENALFMAVRNATAKYHSTNQAIMAGYEPDDFCVSVPGLGGMGYHWANMSLVDPVFDPLKPEVLLYATGPGGNLRLVAVEYIVTDIGQEPPTFNGHPFDVGGTPVPIDHWSQHVWLYEENPTGIYMPFNPNITCP
jgi:hypothetical protein